MRNDDYYKRLSVSEFTKAATAYESDDAGIYKLCKKDYPDILKEIESEEFETLLDAGCGPGPMIKLLSEKYPQKKFTGIDLTEKMIEVAKSKRIENAEFIVGDCENLPFDVGSFDVVICSMSAHHYPNINDFYRSAYRVLKEGGRLIIRDMTVDNNVLAWFCDNIELKLANLIGKGDFKMLRRDDVRKGLEKAGFKVLKCEKRKGMRLHVVGKK